MSNLPNSDPTAGKPPRPRRWIPRSLVGFGVILALLGTASVMLVGVPIWRTQSAIGHIEAAGGLVRKVPGGPAWLRPHLGDYWMSYFDDVVQVRLTDQRATDATLVWLKRFPRLAELTLDGSNVTDDGLAYLKDLKGLGALSLSRTRVTDAGMTHLGGMDWLKFLALDNTAVSDAGLAQLEGLKALEWLSLAHTSVSDRGMQHLRGLLRLWGAN